MIIFFTLMFGFMGAGIGGLFGMLIVCPFEPKGPKVLMRQFAIATLLAALFYAVPALILGPTMFFDPAVVPISMGLMSGFSLGIFLAALITLDTASARVNKYLAMVPLVGPFATTNFAVLDVDQDMVLSEGDLGHALVQTQFASEADQKVLKFMRSNLSEIGHGVGSYTTYNGTSSSTNTVSVISPRDLAGFSEKTFAKYSAWR